MKTFIAIIMAFLLMASIAMATVAVSQLDYVNIGDTASESGHLDMIPDDWSYIGAFDKTCPGYLCSGGYGGYDGGSANFRGLMGAPTGCGQGYEWATFTMHAGSGTADSITIRHLDGSQGDSFNLYIVQNSGDVFVGQYLADGTPSEDWKTTTFNLPTPMTGDIKFKLVAIDPETDWCALGWGQVMINWIELDGTAGSSIPEFGVIAAAVAMIGAVAGIVLFRRH